MSKTFKEQQEILNQGMKLDFWGLLVDALKKNREVLQEDIDSDEITSLPAEQYKLQVELLKAKKRYIDKMIELPNSLIAWLEQPKSERKEFDPYEKSE